MQSNRTMNMLFGACLMATLYPGLSAAKVGLGYLDGSYNPVVSKAYVHTIQPVQNPAGEYADSRIWGIAEKKRSCNYKYMKWYVGKRGGIHTAVPIVIEESSKARQAGYFHFGPWLAHVPWRTLLLRDLKVHADVYHQCHWWGIPYPWKTRTELYG